MYIQGDQLYMAVHFWYRVKSDLPVYVCTFYKVPEKHGHVYLVRLYMMIKEGKKKKSKKGKGKGEVHRQETGVEENTDTQVRNLLSFLLECDAIR